MRGKNPGAKKMGIISLAPGCFLKIVFQKCEVDVEQFLVWPHGNYLIKYFNLKSFTCLTTTIPKRNGRHIFGYFY
jgi:hypothetical protein